MIISSSENDSEIRGKIGEIFDSKSFNLKDAMNTRSTGNIYCKICEQIISSAFGVALVTKNTPKDALRNIFLEIGLMTAFGKEIIILTDDLENIPTDLKGKEVFIFQDDTKLRNDIESWIKDIPNMIAHWRMLTNIWIEDEDYEKAYEYFRKAIMFGDFMESLPELTEILERASKEEITIPKRLKKEIIEFIGFIRVFEGKL